MECLAISRNPSTRLSIFFWSLHFNSFETNSSFFSKRPSKHFLTLFLHLKIRWVALNLPGTFQRAPCREAQVHIEFRPLPRNSGYAWMLRKYPKYKGRTNEESAGMHWHDLGWWFQISPTKINYLKNSRIFSLDFFLTNFNPWPIVDSCCVELVDRPEVKDCCETPAVVFNNPPGGLGDRFGRCAGALES